MLNAKSLLVILTVLGLVVAVLGVVRFGVDVWGYFHAAGANDPSIKHFDYRGCGAALCGFGMAILFFFCYRRKRDW